MLIRSLFAISAFAILAACQPTEKPGFTIIGTISNGFEGYIYLFYQEKEDSVLVKDGTFLFTGQVPYVVEGGLSGDGITASNSLYFGNEEVRVEVETNQGYLLLTNTEGKTALLIDSVVTYVGSILETNQNPAPTLHEYLATLLNGHSNNQFVTEFVSDIINENMLSLEQSKSLLAQIDEKAMIPEYLESVKTTISRMENLKIGDKFPVFELADINSKVISTADYKGSYLLVDFWASWCGPCRKAHPEYKKLYNNLHEKGFDIVSVSIDRFKESWKKAVEKDGLTWTNVHEEDEFQSELLKKLGVVFLPYNYLIDPEGRIALFNTDVPDLAKFLQENIPTSSE